MDIDINDYRKKYLNDIDVLKRIDEETQDFDKLPNNTTKIKGAKSIIIDKHVFQELALDTLNLLGEKCEEVDQLQLDKETIKIENEFLKAKLEDEGIVYSDALTKYCNKHQKLVERKTNTSTLERALHELRLKCKRNYNL